MSRVYPRQTAWGALYVVPDAPAALACSACGDVDADGTHAPGRWVGEDAAYRYEEGPWLCALHSREAWTAHLARVAERLALVYWSQVLGYPLTRAQLARVQARLDGVQLVLL